MQLVCQKVNALIINDIVYWGCSVMDRGVRLGCFLG